MNHCLHTPYYASRRWQIVPSMTDSWTQPRTTGRLYIRSVYLYYASKAKIIATNILSIDWGRHQVILDSLFKFLKKCERVKSDSFRNIIENDWFLFKISQVWNKWLHFVLYTYAFIPWGYVSQISAPWVVSWTCHRRPNWPRRKKNDAVVGRYVF